MDRPVEYFFVAGAKPADGLQRAYDEEEQNIHPFMKTYEANVLTRYPFEDHPGDEFPSMAAKFCFPEGYKLKQPDDIEQTSVPPTYHGFVLTQENGNRMFGICIIVYERFSAAELEILQKNSTDWKEDETYRQTMEEMRQKAKDAKIEIDRMEKLLKNAKTHNEAEQIKSKRNEALGKLKVWRAMNRLDFSNDTALFYPKAIGLLSHCPFFDFFKDYLGCLWQTIMGDPRLPLERYVTNLVCEIPLPPPGIKEVEVFLNNTHLYLRRPPLNDIPIIKNFEFYGILKYLTAEEFVLVMECVLNERPVLLVASDPCVLNFAAMMLETLLFPFSWHFIFIPVWPKSMLSGVIDWPQPFIVGVLDSYEAAVGELPQDAVRVNLCSNSRIRDRVQCTMMPVRLPRTLRESLIHDIRDMQQRESLAPPLGQLCSPDGHLLLVSDKSSITQTNAIVTMLFNLFRRPQRPAAPTTFSDHAIQQFFVNMFAELMRNYRWFLGRLTERQIADGDLSNVGEFLNRLPNEYQEFMTKFVTSLAFVTFCCDRAGRGDSDQDYLYLDALIDGGRNNTILSDRKFYHKEIYRAILPDSRNINGAVSYSRFPESLSASLLTSPRERDQLNDQENMLNMRAHTQALTREARRRENYLKRWNHNRHRRQMDESFQRIHNNLETGRFSGQELYDQPDEYIERRIAILNEHEAYLLGILDQDSVSASESETSEQIRTLLQSVALHLTELGEEVRRRKDGQPRAGVDEAAGSSADTSSAAAAAVAESESSSSSSSDAGLGSQHQTATHSDSGADSAADSLAADHDDHEPEGA